MLTATSKKHYEPAPLVIAERFHFHKQSQTTEESVAEFLAELRRLATHCKFEGYLEQALQDRLACGLRNESIQKKLLSEDNLTLTRAMELAQGMEAADKNAKSLMCIESLLRRMMLVIDLAKLTTLLAVANLCMLVAIIVERKDISLLCAKVRPRTRSTWT